MSGTSMRQRALALGLGAAVAAEAAHSNGPVLVEHATFPSGGGPTRDEKGSNA
jgi:hypothetical protein